jgi:beta-galactosidase
MYTSHSVLADIGAGKVEKYNDKPYFLCEYAHAMGVGPGGLEEYNEIFERYDSLLGGCIWEWADHAVYHGESAGVKHPENCHLQWTYGGDHGERIHDRNFCCDGLMYPDRRPHTGALNMRNAYRPVHAAWVDGKLSFRSYYRFANATHTAAWELRHNGLGVVTGSIALDIPPMGTQEAYLQLPAFGAGDYTLVLRYLAESGEETAFEELALQEQYVAEEIASSGGLTEILSTLRLNITRAWLDNDLCSWNNVSKKALSFRVDCGPAFAMDLRTEALPGGAVKVMVRLEPYERQLPSKDAEVVRFGVTLRLPREWNQVQYYGLGETENLPDLRLAALTGVYSSTVEQMHEPYIMPQDNGNHGQCRWLALTGKDGKGVKITNAPGRFFFSAHSYSQESLDAATHQEDLRDEGTVFLSIDGFIRGAGSASCGADTQDKYKVYVQDGLEFSFVIAGLD